MHTKLIASGTINGTALGQAIEILHSLGLQVTTEIGSVIDRLPARVSSKITTRRASLTYPPVPADKIEERRVLKRGVLQFIADQTSAADGTRTSELKRKFATSFESAYGHANTSRSIDNYLRAFKGQCWIEGIPVDAEAEPRGTPCVWRITTLGIDALANGGPN
jgi:hypothetical protein